MALEPGRRLGAYEIQGSLGAGGMGEVYRARDTKLARDVALKILPAEVAQDQERVARFQREARVLASLNHPNIAAIHGIEEASDLTALVLELVEGPTLAERIAEGPIPVEEALQIARQVAEALEAAHEHGIIHRDLKPANVKVRDDGTVKVLDFGLAKALDEAAAGPAPHDSPAALTAPTLTSPVLMTRAGMLLGTAAYMSPEQARGKPVDRRADIWAFGCVLFEMLAGRSPFESGETVSDAIASILTREPDYTALPPVTPPHIRRLIRRCLQRDLKRRLPHIGLARLEIDEPADVAADAPPESIGSAALDAGRKRWRWAAVALSLTLAVGFAAAAIRWRSPESVSSAVTRFSIALPDGQTFNNISFGLIAISPDGSEIAYVADRRLYRRVLSESEAKAVPGSEKIIGGPAAPAYSPDGREIAFYAPDQTLKRISRNGGAAITICETQPVAGISWGAQGIVFAQPTKGVLKVSPDGGRPEVIVPNAPGELAFAPEWLPDGRTVLFSSAPVAAASSPAVPDQLKVVVQSLTTGQRKVVVEGGSGAHFISSGHIAYLVGGVMFALPFDLERLAVRGGPVPVVEGVRRSAITGASQFSVSRTGSLAYAPGPASVSVAVERDLAFIDRNGSVEPLKLPPAPYVAPRVSPDGKRLAVGIDDGKVADVFVYDLTGGSRPRRITFQSSNRYPVWSRDGRRVAFQSDRGGDRAIWWQGVDGGAAERLTTPVPGASHVVESWSPREDVLAVAIEKDAKFSLWMLSLPQRTLKPFGGVQSSFPPNAVFSPDGRWLAYASGDGSYLVEIYLQRSPSTGDVSQISRDFRSHHPLWAPTDGSELYYTPGPTRFVSVAIDTRSGLVTGSPTTLVRPPGELGSPLAVRSYDT